MVRPRRIVRASHSVNGDEDEELQVQVEESEETSLLGSIRQRTVRMPAKGSGTASDPFTAPIDLSAYHLVSLTYTSDNKLLVTVLGDDEILAQLLDQSGGEVI